MKLKVVFESEKIESVYMDGEKKFEWTNGNSGIDLRNAEEAFVLNPGENRLVKTGVRVQLQSDNDLWEIQLRPRSGMSARGVLKHFGTIDYNYTGVMGCTLTNVSQNPISIEFGDRIAQIVVCPIAKPTIEITDTLNETNRGDRGFGSSGMK